MDDNAAARLKRQILRVAYWIGLFLAMLTICLPGLWIVLSSLRPTVEIMAKPPVWIPNELSFDAYVAMFSGIGQGGIPVTRPVKIAGDINDARDYPTPPGGREVRRSSPRCFVPLNGRM